MSILDAVILGLIQGLTEFLPVSSSGHLVLGQYWLDIDSGAGGITFEVFVHFGTLLSVVTVYFKQLILLGNESLAMARNPRNIKKRIVENESSGLVFFILLSMIPTGVIYVLFKDPIEGAFENPKLVCGMLLATGTLLLLTLLRKHPDGRLAGWKSLLIGLAQGAALIPGISRSGSTIATALYCNVSREKAAEFSFLMSLPVIFGATLLKALELSQAKTAVEMWPLIFGTLIAYFSGIWAIKLVIGFVRRGKIQWFAAYCYVLGVIGLLFI